MKRPNILVLSFFPAFFPPRSGGEERLFHMYDALSKDCDVTLISSSYFGGSVERIVHAPSFVEHRVGKQQDYFYLHDYLSSLAGGVDVSGIAFGMSGHYPGEFHRVYLENYRKADAIIHESPFTVFHDLMLGLDSKPRVYNSYNAEYILAESIYPTESSSLLVEYTRTAEKCLLENSQLVTFCSDADRVDMEALLGRPVARGRLLPNGAALHFKPERKSRSRRPGEKPKLIFLGSGHAPNRDVVDLIVGTLAPQALDMEFHLVGNCAKPGRLAENIIAYGAVSAEEKAHLLEQADIALNPMRTGSGSNLKAIEYMAFGLPIIATSFGMRGTFAEAGRHYVRVEPEQVIAAARKLVADASLMIELGEAASELVEARLTWRSIADSFKRDIYALFDEEDGVGSRIICLNDYDPIENVGGGVTRIRGLERALSRRSEVLHLCFWNGATISRESFGDGIAVIRVPKNSEHKLKTEELNLQHHIASDDVVSYLYAPKNDVIVGLYRILQPMSEIVIVEHPYMASLVARSDAKFLYSSQNDEFSLKSKMLEFHPSREYLLETIKEAEDYCLSQAVLVVAVSDDDLQSFSSRQRSASVPIVLVPNGADGAANPSAGDLLAAEVVGPRSVVFVGSMHMPNVEAVWRIRDIYARELPDVEFHIVGSAGGALGSDYPSNIRAWGQISSGLKSAILHRAVLAINPVNSGGGSNVKLSDYFAHGLFTLSTPFGIRGYPPSVERFVEVAEANEFSAAISRRLRTTGDASVRSQAVALFAEELSMEGHATHFAELVKQLNVQRKRLLFVTYRYTSPPLGGGEVMMLELLRQLSGSGLYDIDVVFTDVGTIYDRNRFTSNYGGTDDLPAPSNLANVSWRRFPLDAELDPGGLEARAAKLWRLQGELEHRAASKAYDLSGLGRDVLVSGWHHREGRRGSMARWATDDARFYAVSGGTVRCAGHSPRAKEVVITTSSGVLSRQVLGAFEIEFSVSPGLVTLRVEAEQYFGSDVRPLGLRLTELSINGRNHIEEATLWEGLQSLDFETVAGALDLASGMTRGEADCDLTSVRGPFSSKLENWIDKNLQNYELVLTHNCVFRPPVKALEVAKREGVPSIFIPHIHLDDDYYHFPDVQRAIDSSTLCLASPRSTCAFLKGKSRTEIDYLGAGVSPEEFSEGSSWHDIEAFRKVWPDERPFVLVLGRKSGAKNYRVAIDAANYLGAVGQDVPVLLIGHDEDLEPVEGQAVYLGPQPRHVVRGALRCALALVNMSQSESFGIVLLEAWLAGAPVIANANCPAFADLVRHNENGFLVTDAREIAQAVMALLESPERRSGMSRIGRATAEVYTWENLGRQLVMHITRLINSSVRYGRSLKNVS